MKLFKSIRTVNEYVGFQKIKYLVFFKWRFKIGALNFASIKAQCKEHQPKPYFTPHNKTNQKAEISIAAIYKNEPDIVEWIEYHRLIGVERFYLYDNESNDDSREKLSQYINENIVIYHKAKGRKQQLNAYKDAIYRYKNDTKWLAIIDLDEYIVPIQKNSLQEFLKEYENYCAIGINWQMFDSNGYIKKPKIPVIEAYTKTSSEKSIVDLHIKTIVNPRMVSYVTNPHFCLYKQHRLAVNENHENIGQYPHRVNDNAFTKENSINKIKINHYHVKSREDYLRKVNTGYADSNLKRNFLEENLNFKNPKEDLIIQKYLPQLKERLGYK